MILNKLALMLPLMIGGCAPHVPVDPVTIDQRIPPKVIEAMIQVESGGDPKARSHKGAIGLM